MKRLFDLLRRWPWPLVLAMLMLIVVVGSMPRRHDIALKFEPSGIQIEASGPQFQRELTRYGDVRAYLLEGAAHLTMSSDASGGILDFGRVGDGSFWHEFDFDGCLYPDPSGDSSLDDALEFCEFNDAMISLSGRRSVSLDTAVNVAQDVSTFFSELGLQFDPSASYLWDSNEAAFVENVRSVDYEAELSRRWPVFRMNNDHYSVGIIFVLTEFSEIEIEVRPIFILAAL